jgi:hypothetical protein
MRRRKNNVNEIRGGARNEFPKRLARAIRMAV